MRYIDQSLKKDLLKKMVFISGPRQCGKTTLAQSLQENHFLYLNWDDIDDRRIILKRNWGQDTPLVILDEIHKYTRWKNFLKGTYDKQKSIHHFLITGSARLDIFKKGQDSMLGRFFSYRLHPFCLSEATHQLKIEDKNLINRFLIHGGFPEPFLENDEIFSKRWRKEKMNLVFRQDIRDLENVKDINLLEMLYDLLTKRVSAEISYSNLARDLEVSPNTVKNWITILEKTYSLFIVTPYSKKLAKAIVKSPKIYFYDNGEVDGDMGAKFENLVANHLLKKIHYLEDTTGDRYELNFIRDRNGPEVDFVIFKNKRPILLIEAKLSDENISKHLIHFKEKLKIPHAVQLVLHCQKPRCVDNILVTDAQNWLSQKLENLY